MKTRTQTARKPIRTGSRKTKRTKTIQTRSYTKYIILAVAFLVIIICSPLYYGYIIKFYVTTKNWIKNGPSNMHYPKYSEFGIRIPDQYSVHGIDVSYYQGNIDWQAVKKVEVDGIKVDFVFIKATEGLTKVDPTFHRNWREAAKAGLLCGAYHFFRPQQAGKAQARFFLQVANYEKGDLPPVVDIEELNGVSPAKMRKELTAFIEYVKKETGKSPIIYTGLKFYEDYLRNYYNEELLWLAHYYKKELRIGSSENWRFWQHSDKATITGINHVVDFNSFRGSKEELYELSK